MHSVGQAVAQRRHQLLGELASRHAQARIHDVACAVELGAFDDPAFHDHVARAQASVFRTTQVVHGILGLVGSAAGAIGSLVALAALQPLLLPLALLAVVPGAMLSGRRAEAFDRVAFSLTPRDRERDYLAHLLTERDPAKEVRAMGLARFLRRRHDALRAERIAALEPSRAASSGGRCSPAWRARPSSGSRWRSCSRSPSATTSRSRPARRPPGR